METDEEEESVGKEKVRRKVREVEKVRYSALFSAFCLLKLAVYTS